MPDIRHYFFYLLNKKERLILPIKIFKLKNNQDIEKIINDWEYDNKFKIDSITITPNELYFNNDKTYIDDIEHIYVINYHKRRIRKNTNVNS